MSQLRLSLGLAMLAGLTACAGGGGGNEPPPSVGRPAVSIPDEVGAIDRAALIGRWTCRDLNPVPGHPSTVQSVEFMADGKARNAAIVDMAAQGMPMGGRMAMNFAYDWRVEGERILASNVVSDIKAVDGNAMTGMMAGMSQMVANRFGNQAKPGNTDVMKLTAGELILRSADVRDPPVIGCTRA